VARLVELTVRAAGNSGVSIAVHHLAAKERAETVADQLRDQIPDVREVRVAELGAVIGAHLGPGVIGIVLSRR
jgi:fatty acid-binding protein DegV